MIYQVLIVDDEEIVCRGMAQFVKWKEHGFEVAAIATSVDEALLILRKMHIDVVFTDIRMPEKSGIDLLREIREQKFDTQCVILSGYSDFDYAKEAMRYGAVEYLTKPVNLREVEQFLDRMRTKLNKLVEERLDHTRQMEGLLLSIARGYATLAAEWTEWFFQYYVWQAGGDLTKENEDGTAELTFTDPAVIQAAEYYQKLKSEGVLQSDLTLKFNDLVKNFGMGKIGMMPFAGDWVSEAITNGIDPDDIGLCLPPVGPSGEQTTAIAGDCYVINAKTDQAKKDAVWEYISYMTGKEYRSSYFENLATKGAPNPVIIPRDDMSITDFYEFPEEYAEVLESAKSIGRLEFYGKADFGTYVDKAVQKILTDPSADPEKEFSEAQSLCEKEALEKFNEANKK